MLLKCPECDLQVSDKAYFLPTLWISDTARHQTKKAPQKNNKRKRLPNGFGQISEIKNRNP